MKNRPRPWDNRRPFIAVDLDRTLAKLTNRDADNGRWGPTWIGPPVPRILRLVKKWIREGKEVRIFTTRLQYGKEAKKAVQRWLKQNGLGNLKITNRKDHMMVAILDDTSVAVEPNTGKILGTYRTWAWRKYYED